MRNHTNPSPLEINWQRNIHIGKCVRENIKAERAQIHCDAKQHTANQPANPTHDRHTQILTQTQIQTKSCGEQEKHR